jgi:hypothetical protein
MPQGGLSTLVRGHRLAAVLVVCGFARGRSGLCVVKTREKVEHSVRRQVDSEGHRPASSGPVTHHVISCIQVLSVVVTEEEILEGLLGCVAEEDVSCVLAECGFERPQQASVAVEGCAYLGLRA